MTTQTKRPAIWQAQADADAAYEVYLDNAARSCILVFEHEGFGKAEFEKETLVKVADADTAYEVYLDNAARSCILVFEHEGFEKAEFEKETRAIQISRWTGADFYQVCNDIDDAITELH